MANKVFYTNSTIVSQVSWESISDKPDFSAVAATGNYDDLLNAPVLFIPSGTTAQYIRGDGSYAAFPKERGVIGVAISAPTNGTRVIFTAPFPMTLLSFNAVKTSAGSISVSVAINATPVTGLSGSATTTPQNLAATAANTISAGQEITLITTSNSSAENLTGTLYLEASF